jgi:hypothetical protein
MKLAWRLSVLLLLASLSVSGQAKDAPADSDKIWVVVRPVQCMGNPWEKDWMAKHKNRADQYPRKKEFGILKTYFAKKRIPILEIRLKPYVKGDPLCAACDCARGDTVYLLTYAQYTPTLVKLGYTQRVPAPDVNPKN